MEPDNTTASSCLDSTAFKVTVSVALTALILITIAGNVVVCLAVGLNRRLRSLTNCFIVSLAITDLLLGLLVLPFSAIYQLSYRWSFGKVFCNIYTSLDVMLCTASILNLFMISLDRYYAITDPLRYPVLVTPTRVGISLVLIWAISITLSFLPIHLEWNSSNKTSGFNSTILSCKVQVNLVYGLVDGLVTFYVPLVVMCITYCRIFKIARDQAKRIYHTSSWKAATIREHKATVTLAAVMGAFIGCWFPYFTVFVYRGLKGDDAINKVFEAVVLWLGYANSALNPILYAALNRDFRTAYQQLLRCRSASLNVHDPSLRSNNSRLCRTQRQEPRQLEEKPLRLQVWSGREVTAPRGTTDREFGEGGLPTSAWERKSREGEQRERRRKAFYSLKSQGESIMTPQESLERKPKLSCSSNLLSCCKSLWGLRFLQARGRPLRGAATADATRGSGEDAALPACLDPSPGH